MRCAIQTPKNSRFNILFVFQTVVMEQKRRTDGRPQLPIRDVLTPQVTVAVLSYGCLALVDVAYIGLQPLFYSTKVELGGLGLSVPDIGLALGLSGIWVGIVAATCFGKVHHRFGARPVFIAGVLAFIPMLLLFPVMNHLARFQGKGLLTTSALVLQLALYPLSGMSYSALNPLSLTWD